MTAMTPRRHSVHNPVDVERKIEETKNRIAAGVKIVTAAEREHEGQEARLRPGLRLRLQEAPKAPSRTASTAADIETMPHREEADNAEIAFKHAEPDG